MKRQKRGTILLAFSAGILFLLGSVLLPETGRAEVIIIANPSVSVSEITKGDLEKIYTGKQVVWKDGQPIKPALLETGDLHTDFITQYVGKTTNQFINYWRRMIFTGQGIQPRTFGMVGDLIEYVAETPGAVGYISSSDQAPNTKTLVVPGN